MVDIRKLKKNQIDPIRRRNIIISLRKILIYTSIVVIWDAFLLFEVNNSSVYSSQYVIRYAVAIFSSIILMILVTHFVFQKRILRN